MAITLKVNLPALIREKAETENRRITLAEIKLETGLSYLTLQKLSKGDGDQGCNKKTLEALCNYFNKPINEVLVEVRS